MCLQVRWTITPLRYPQPWRSCSRCNQHRPYRCSGKFRLNANGRRLDAWLIYNCAGCDDRWNYPVLERVTTKDIDRDVLSALHSNEPTLVHHFAFDVAALRRRAHKVEEFAEVSVEKQVIAGTAQEPPQLEIVLIVPIPVSIRLDRLLAGELGLSRGRLSALSDSGLLRTSAALNKPAQNASIVRIGLPAEEARCLVEASNGGP